MSAQKPDAEKLPLMCALRFLTLYSLTLSPLVRESDSGHFRLAAESDARSAVAAAPTHFAAFKALAVALGKKSRFSALVFVAAD